MKTIVLVLAIAAVNPAFGADDGAAQTVTVQAKEHFRLGTQHYDLGRYLEAAKEYEQAFQLSDRPLFLFNIAQAYRLAGKHQQALAAYLGYLRRVPEATQRAEVERHIDELTNRIKAEQAATAAKNVEPPPSVPALVSAPPSASPRKRRTTIIAVSVAVGALVIGGVVTAVLLTTPGRDPSATMGTVHGN